MAVSRKNKRPKGRGKRRPAPGKLRLLAGRVAGLAARVFWWALGLQAVVVFLLVFINPPTNFYMLTESIRLKGVLQTWVAIEDMSPHLPRAVVAAEDANFCRHWGFDLAAIRLAVTEGDGRLRGASTISQQVAKNVFLWQGRSWLRKVLEAETTLMVELFWSKRRIVEVYLNVAEFDEGVFGVGAAATHYFGKGVAELSLLQASRLAAILPNPKGRSASSPSQSTRKRTASIMDGARTIDIDGRADCFQ